MAGVSWPSRWSSRARTHPSRRKISVLLCFPVPPSFHSHPFLPPPPTPSVSFAGERARTQKLTKAWLAGGHGNATRRWADPARIRRYETFFGGDVNAEVIKVSKEDRIVAIKLTTGEAQRGKASFTADTGLPPAACPRVLPPQHADASARRFANDQVVSAARHGAPLMRAWRAVCCTGCHCASI